MATFLQSIYAFVLVLSLVEFASTQWGYSPYGGYGGYGGYGMGGYGGYGMGGYGGGYGGMGGYGMRRMMMGMYNPYMMYGK